MDNERFFQGLIVLEEFIKELLSIAQSNCNLYGLQKIARLDSPAPVAISAEQAAAARAQSHELKRPAGAASAERSTASAIAKASATPVRASVQSPTNRDKQAAATAQTKRVTTPAGGKSQGIAPGIPRR